MCIANQNRLISEPIEFDLSSKLPHLSSKLSLPPTPPSFAERTSLLFRRVQGDDSLDTLSSPFNRRTKQLCVLGGVFLLFLLFLLSIITTRPTSAPGYPAGPPFSRARSPVPKNLEPLPYNEGQKCMDLAAQTAPAGQKFIQIHNRCSGEVIYPGTSIASPPSLPPSLPPFNFIHPLTHIIPAPLPPSLLPPSSSNDWPRRRQRPPPLARSHTGRDGGRGGERGGEGVAF